MEGPGALLTDAKTPGIVAKVKQTTVAVARFRSALAHEETFFPTAFLPFALRHNRSNSTLSPSGVGRDCHSFAALAILPTLAKVDLQDWMKNEPVAIIRDDNRESNSHGFISATNSPCFRVEFAAQFRVEIFSPLLISTFHLNAYFDTLKPMSTSLDST